MTSPRKETPGGFLSDVQTLRRRAREHIERGAVTEGYLADRSIVLGLLDAVLRYKRHYHMAKGIHSQAVAAEFLEHAAEEQEHADQIASRICQLGGSPNFNPEGLTGRSHSEYIEGESLIEMIQEDLVAERIAIDSYSEMIRYIGDADPTTHAMLKEILAKEEEHADDMANLLATIDPRKKTE